ncbi:HNH endonuclease [Bifidobacterium bifidum]|uniref:HNH endonuclease n=2 Tax=Bifidobacterium TaxID=1678 RepID=UPI001D0153CF|nr:HNH endonuclease [Bifidobacterium bifidum]MCC3149520.1 HNH endonuclease [Bifidobacterium bifidum]MCG2835002.1 HNH endonuclease [Bifidobacterium bifidum]MDB1300566.1 HNH endonuclease [Bifidobacterium bifidum]MDB1302805.1 HNH endonuclease [Bifidobacterium bifidum]MDB1306043.1 HNH endonuclease [Bifidobacterium bifidum]
MAINVSSSAPRRNWSREETMMAFALYIVLEPRECDDKGLDVQRLASFLHRTPSSVALKIWNIAAYDANRKACGRVGMKHGSKLDSQVWQWYAEDPDAFMKQCLDVLRRALLQANASNFTPAPLAPDRHSPLETATALLIDEHAPTKEERPITMLQRVNQSYFRNSLLQNYHGTCCITGMQIPKLLIASHIKPWKASTPNEKTAASNGLLLNAFHDRAFDQGLISIDDDYRIMVNHDKVRHSDINDRWLYDFDGHEISLPAISQPSHEFIEYHHKHIFLANAA